VLPGGLMRHGFQNNSKAAHVAFRQMRACLPRMPKFDVGDNNFIRKVHVYGLSLQGGFYHTFTPLRWEICEHPFDRKIVNVNQTRFENDQESLRSKTETIAATTPETSEAAKLQAEARQRHF
jgi:hypothetical protein